MAAIFHVDHQAVRQRRPRLAHLLLVGKYVNFDLTLRPDVLIVISGLTKIIN